MDDNGLQVTGDPSTSSGQAQPVVIPPQAVVSQVPQAPAAVTQPTPVQAVGQVVQSGVVTPPVFAPGYGEARPPFTQGFGGVQKEQMVVPAVPEKTPLVELYESEKIPPEVEGWMEKLEQAGEIKIPEAIKHDEQVILENAKPTTVQDTVVLPLSQSGAAVAAKKTVSDSAKWLYVWCVRLVKMLGERARWGKENPTPV